MAPKKVKEETGDRIVLVDSVMGNILYGLSAIVVGSLVLLFGISIFNDPDNELFVQLVFLFVYMLFGGCSILMGLHRLTIVKSVIIDKRRQNIIIKKYSFIKYLKSIEKIPFPHIKEIEILRRIERYSQWKLALITIDEKYVGIYEGESESGMEKTAEKICKITDKEATHRTEYIPVESP